ncbi:tRNA(Phe) (4-demethylwyosine(37)-C(7)) aminocarboxypropyltransferase [Aspergillus homomorphus CBS 101889]|uniref:tRNA wybutosine-synthesizing protein 2 n=1 Tax=Aspergillus homomorphus (strain CBS 101889) TaxID=1450537 RepID=A0A395I1R2_ASPHC|nr:hypothetical protein BO97DRAFT_17052 [Aspergillus homomorphus CBS 101889]RAL14010.1 hypothetical protein BO97DRAFT_17052 [Aspergillus homomorphus CBS 101889]
MPPEPQGSAHEATSSPAPVSKPTSTSTSTSTPTPAPNPSSTPHHPRKPKKPTLNPLHQGIQTFMTQHMPHQTDLLSETSLPKRFTIHEPLLLLPVNALTTPPAWHAFYAALTAPQRNTLFTTILQSFSRYNLTHVAMNAPIAPTDPVSGTENRIRSPGGLIPLYGDFGPLPSPSVSSSQGEGEGEEETLVTRPSPEDLEQAFWVRTVQNHGIVQIWAPLYTMFSRGNITEKARILGAEFEGLSEAQLGGQGVQEISVVDMYAGIGYFVYSYLRRGVKRVWGFEINGWSVEGLRRGCIENGWGCRVFQVDGDDGSLLGGCTVRDVVDALKGHDDVRVVVFHGDNRFAARILGEVRRCMGEEWARVRHVNLGLLPSSQAAYGNACAILDADMGGWAHVHENVDVRRIEEKRDEVTAQLGRLRADVLGVGSASVAAVAAECHHVEQVKTYAPGVMHCVFDVRLASRGEMTASNPS